MTKEQLAERYEAAKQRHMEKQEKDQPTKEDENSSSTEPKDFKNGIEVEEEEDKDKETFVAFARVFSGTLKKGTKVYVLGPKYDPALKMVESTER